LGEGAAAEPPGFTVDEDELDEERIDELLQVEVDVVVHLHLLEFVVIMDRLGFRLGVWPFCTVLFGFMPYQFVVLFQDSRSCNRATQFCQPLLKEL